MAAATIGASNGLLRSGEPAALVLGALVTIGALTLATAMASKRPSFQKDPAGAESQSRHAHPVARHEAPSPE
jgi:hypothetical protein